LTRWGKDTAFFYLCDMKIRFLFLYKTSGDWLQSAFGDYSQRLSKYISLEISVLPGVKASKNLKVEMQKQAEGIQILTATDPSDILILLDERGNQFTSAEFAQFLQGHMNASSKRLVFCVGGPYGFSEEVYRRADFKLSFSKFTFSHQMIRLLLAEQLYRAMTILRNEPYHNE
jgi:23S rRNA (pseudouridine1915-N3)-methyltransferase